MVVLVITFKPTSTPGVYTVASYYLFCLIWIIAITCYVSKRNQKRRQARYKLRQYIVRPKLYAYDHEEDCQSLIHNENDHISHSRVDMMHSSQQYVPQDLHQQEQEKQSKEYHNNDKKIDFKRSPFPEELVGLLEPQKES